MCVEHSNTIDDPSTRFNYPDELLEQWKSDQLKECEQLKKSWSLDTKMAKEVIEASFSNVGVAISNSTLSLGGEGGKTPGAGGGGGGAIGEGARGGDGGGGGGITREIVDLAELVEAGFDHAELKVGFGGVGASLAGQHGKEGEASVVNFVGSDGTVLKSIRAEPGTAGRSAASYLPDGVGKLTRKDVDQGFRITTLLPVNSAEIRDNLLYVLGGGWEHFVVPSIPFDAIWCAVVTARWQGKFAEPRGFFLSLIDPQGKETSCVALHVPLEAIPAKIGNWVCPIGATFDAEGIWTLTLHSGDILLSEYPVRVFIAK